MKILDHAFTDVVLKHRRMAPGKAGTTGRPATVGVLLAIGGVCGLITGAAHSAETTVVTDGLVLDHVTIVDTHDGKLTSDAAIIIANGKIAKIAQGGRVSTGGSAKLIEARGKFVVPGYNDMHAHPLGSTDPEGAMTLMVANGVTGVRQMSGSPELLEKRKAGTVMPPGPTPELLSMPGEVLTYGNAGTPTIGVAEVRKQKAQGTDFIKSVDVSIPTFFAALDEANQQGLLYEGHLSQGVDAIKASQAGMRAVEHLGPPKDTVWVNCSTDEAALRNAIAKIPPREVPNVPPSVMVTIAEVAIAEPALVWARDPMAFQRLQHEMDTFSEDKCRKVADTYAANRTWQVPTLIRLKTIDFGDDTQFRNDPNLRYVPRPTRQLWERVAERFSGVISPGAKATLKQSWEMELKLVKMFDQAGVPMLAGSDYGGQWQIAGFDLHQEFDALAEAGLSPLTILQMTTLNGARFYGREADMGSVAVGRNANLVLLDANPVQSAQNLHGIFAVVRAGTYLSRSDLDGLKSRTGQRVASGASAPTARTEQTNAP